jgi:glycerol-3-phosphate dehydrogenase (NAD(P)+)
MKVGVVGGGSWGTALALVAAEQSAQVTLWCREADLACQINQQRENPRYLPGVRLPEKISATGDLLALVDHEILLIVVPSAAMAKMASQLAQSGLLPQRHIISCTKGIELHTGRRMSEVLEQALPDHLISVLSGPNHAEEIARRKPAAAVIGASDEKVAQALQTALSCPWLRLYTSTDVSGIEWGAATKNVFAIAAGIISGLDLGDNARAALITRGLVEMTRLGLAMGGTRETFQGLSGLGDLVVTCFSPHSRNFRVGEALGRGQTLSEITSATTMVAEGVPNTQSIYELSSRHGLNTPIIDTVYAVLYGEEPCRAALGRLFTRDLRPEFDEPIPGVAF